MHRISVDDCAREYFGLWSTRETEFVDGLESSDIAHRLQAIRDAAGYFKIARNFPETFDVGRGKARLAPALDAVDKVLAAGVTEDNLVSRVADLRREFRAVYGERDLLSAATKFLWLRAKDSVIIFDGNARPVIGTATADYAAYVKEWRRRYRIRQVEIGDACSRMLSAASGADPESARLSEAPEWFRRRVFDIYLWRTGAPRPRDA